MRYATQNEIKAARKLAGLTYEAAGKMVHVTGRAWRMWESGDRLMTPGLWELFQIKTKKYCGG